VHRLPALRRQRQISRHQPLRRNQHRRRRPFSLVGATNTLGNAVPGFYEVSYTGNDTRRSIQTSSSSKLSYGTTGDQLFSNVEYKYAETVDGVTTTYTWNNPNLTPEDPCDFNTLQAVSDLKSYLKCGGALSAEQLSYLQEKYGMYTIDSSGTYSATKDTPDADTIFKRILASCRQAPARCPPSWRPTAPARTGSTAWTAR
jgi:hypothetical protein